MNDNILDLSGFTVTRPAGKPYGVFDPKNDKEYQRLSDFLHMPEVKETFLKEAVQYSEEQKMDPMVTNHLWRIYAPGLKNAETGVELKTSRGEVVYILFVMLLKAGAFTSTWVAFLCREEELDALKADEDSYADECIEWLEYRYTPPSGGKN